MLAKTRLKEPERARPRPRRTANGNGGVRRAAGRRPVGAVAEAQARRRLTPASMQPSGISLGVTLAVLGAGMLHAGWNALLKSAPGGDPLLDTAASSRQLVLVAAGAAVRAGSRCRPRGRSSRRRR